MNKSISASIFIAIVIIGGAILLTSDVTPVTTSRGGESVITKNVSIIDGVQIIELKAKGGYSPRRSVAEAGIPTVIRFDGINTFDCSLSVRIPSLNINQFLAQTEKTDIDIGIQKFGLFRGSCSMGMYPFEVDFK